MLESWTESDGETPSLGGSAAPGKYGILRPMRAAPRLEIGEASSFCLPRATASRARRTESFSLQVTTLMVEPWQRQIQHGQVFAVDGDQALVATTAGVELHHLGTTDAPIELALPEIDSAQAVALPLVAEGRALATYIALDGAGAPRAAALRSGHPQ